MLTVGKWYRSLGDNEGIQLKRFYTTKFKKEIYRSRD